MEVKITMTQKEKEEFVELLLSPEYWDAPNSSGYQLYHFVKDKSEYLDVVAELSKYYEEYRVKDALEKDFLKLVVDTKDERYIEKEYFEGDDYEGDIIKEFYENLESRSYHRLKQQDKNDVYVTTNN